MTLKQVTHADLQIHKHAFHKTVMNTIPSTANTISNTMKPVRRKKDLFKRGWTPK